MSQKILKCPYCNSDLKLTKGFTGADWNCEEGKDSDYGWEISLKCTNDKCAIFYPLGYTKRIGDFSEVIDKYKFYR